MDNLLTEMANEFDLDAAVSGDLDSLELEDFPQFAESDMNYLTRMSQKIGAVAKPTDGHLVFADDMRSKSTSGANLPTKYVDVAELGEYSCSFKETESSSAVGTVFANWYDREKGEYFMVKAGSGDPESGRVEQWRVSYLIYVSIALLVKRSMQLSRTALSYYFRIKVYVTYHASNTFGSW
jgi:phage protein D